MELVIDIPKEFERDWNNDKFQDCFGRVLLDLKDASFLSGNYEKETLEMLQSALRDAKEYDKEDYDHEDVLTEEER